MGRYATRKALKGYCAQAGVTLYEHRLDGASYQYCAGGYIINGYLGQSMLLSSLQYEMQKTLIFLLKYGFADLSFYQDGTSIVWQKEPHAISPLAEPLCNPSGMKVQTLGTPEDDKDLQEFFDSQKL
jgi:hypothetical protein